MKLDDLAYKLDGRPEGPHLVTPTDQSADSVMGDERLTRGTRLMALVVGEAFSAEDYSSGPTAQQLLFWEAAESGNIHYGQFSRVERAADSPYPTRFDFIVTASLISITAHFFHGGKLTKAGKKISVNAASGEIQENPWTLYETDTDTKDPAYLDHKAKMDELKLMDPNHKDDSCLDSLSKFDLDYFLAKVLDRQV